MSKGLTYEPGTGSTHEKGGTYDIAYQENGAMDILDSDEDGNEFPAKEGWYFKQFVPFGADWRGVNGWFGPYSSADDMPEIVRANFTSNTSTPCDK